MDRSTQSINEKVIKRPSNKVHRGACYE